MIKKLRVKFICVIMAIVTVMLMGIFGVVIHFTAQSMEVQSLNMMRAIASSPFQQNSLNSPGEEVRLPFFTVQISTRGELITAGGGYFDLSDRELLQQIINDVLQSEAETGKLERHDLRYLKSISPTALPSSFPTPPRKKPPLETWFIAAF